MVKVYIYYICVMFTIVHMENLTYYYTLALLITFSSDYEGASKGVIMSKFQLSTGCLLHFKHKYRIDVAAWVFQKGLMTTLVEQTPLLSSHTFSHTGSYSNCDYKLLNYGISLFDMFYSLSNHFKIINGRYANGLEYIIYVQ